MDIKELILVENQGIFTVLEKAELLLLPEGQVLAKMKEIFRRKVLIHPYDPPIPLDSLENYRYDTKNREDSDYSVGSSFAVDEQMPPTGCGAGDATGAP